MKPPLTQSLLMVGDHILPASADLFPIVFQAATGNRVKNIGDIESLMDNDHIATFRDVDGSVTSVPGSQIVPANDFFMTPSCERRSNWDMAYCPYHYGLVSSSKFCLAETKI